MRTKIVAMSNVKNGNNSQYSIGNNRNTNDYYGDSTIFETETETE